MPKIRVSTEAVQLHAAGRGFEPAEWLHEPECGARVAQAWREVRRLKDWLSAHVGPSRREVPARR